MATKRIKSYEEACKKLKLKSAVPSFPNLSAPERKAMQAHYKLVIIARALNGDWKPDWLDWDQNKYYPWFDFQGSRFVFHDVHFHCTRSFLGSRLCFRSRELAEYAGKTFTDLYHEYFQIE
jgi:hypothetical protein